MNKLSGKNSDQASDSKNLISGAEFSLTEQKQIIADALAYKKICKSGGTSNEAIAAASTAQKLPDLSGQVLTLLFANPSLRTRLSFETGMKKMQGIVNTISGQDTWQFEYEDGVVMDKDKQEHIKEAAAVLASYSDIIGLRKSELITNTTASQAAAALATDPQTAWSELKADQAINQLALYAKKPVINMESNMFHPCQSLADMMTMTEIFGDSELHNKQYVLTWAPHPKPLPLATPHSQLLTPAIFGMNVTLVHPEGFELDESVMTLAQQKSKEAGGTLTITHDQQEAFQGADIIMAKSWASLKYFGDWQAEAAHRAKYTDWTVTASKMALTNSAKFMHCLPVRRNVVVSDEVLDGPNSIVIQEAENRMWIQMAIINYLLNN